MYWKVRESTDQIWEQMEMILFSFFVIILCMYVCIVFIYFIVYVPQWKMAQNYTFCHFFP